MENHQYSQTDSVYACPMHPEVTGKKGDQCSKCGMDLVPVGQKASQQYQVQLTTAPQTIEAGAPAKLAFTFKEGDQTVPLGIAHEMKVHLMVISDDLTWFRHIHPEEQADGSYAITETFPHGGKYLLYTDFKPEGGASTVNKQEIVVKGNPGTQQESTTSKVVSVVDGYTLTLENGMDFKTNKTQPLEISIEKDGKKLAEKDVQQYLGATAHIVMIGKADKDYLHIHPVSDKRFLIYAETGIKKPGVYRMWVQFQTKGVVHTADFTVHVEAGDASEAAPHSHSHAH